AGNRGPRAEMACAQAFGGCAQADPACAQAGNSRAQADLACAQANFARGPALERPIANRKCLRASDFRLRATGFQSPARRDGLALMQIRSWTAAGRPAAATLATSMRREQSK